MNVVNTTYNSTEQMINKLQQLKCKAKLKFYENISNFYNEMKNKYFQTQEYPFSKHAQGNVKIYEVLLLMKCLQTKPQVRNLNVNYYDLFYTVIITTSDKDNIDHQYEDDAND